MKKEEKKEKVASKKENTKKNSRATDAKNVSSEKKKNGNIFKRIGRYFKGVLKETKRIKWTTGKELVKYSIAAIVFVVFFGLYFYGIDWIALLVRSLAK